MEYVAKFAEILASTGERTGVVWGLQERADLKVNLVRFARTDGIGEHVKG
jgi:hypothetical protein